MIPPQVNEVITTGVAHIGCVSSNLKPFHADTLGIVCDPESDKVVCCLNRDSSEAFLDHLVVGSRMSLFAAVITHESYNLKGHVTEIRDVNADELAACNKLMKEMFALYNEMGIPEELAARYWKRTPDLAISFLVDTIFSQTPGPDAGKQL
tara:strand:- start:121 stop:573 length:453 start_codon:yes stop_codon:yes gene_type:complete